MLTHERLKELLKYNPQTGLFTWLVSTRNTKPGMVAGWDGGNGYRMVTVDFKKYPLHRLAWFYAHGMWPKNLIDHENGKKQDNWLDNLREATHSQNGQNKHKTQSNNTSGFAGVSWDRRRKKWLAVIKLEGVQKYIGIFKTKEEAHEAYLKQKRVIHPYYNEGVTVKDQ